MPRIRPDLSYAYAAMIGAELHVLHAIDARTLVAETLTAAIQREWNAGNSFPIAARIIADAVKVQRGHG